MKIHGSKEHCLDIAKFLRRAKKRAVKTALFEFLFEINGDYIHTHITPILTYLTSSLQTSLHFWSKQKANRKQLINKKFIRQKGKFNYYYCF